MRFRLQKIMSDGGVASRRAAERMIADGRVSINGRVASLGESADPNADRIEIDGAALLPGSKKLYIALNKPRKFVTTMSDERGRHCVTELVADIGARLYPVGRLDMDSEGLLIMTNDGDFANRVMHPSSGFAKKYQVFANGDIEAGLPLLREMRMIGDDPITPCEVSVIRRFETGALLSFIIHEGRNRQIRRMCDSAGLAVTKLLRVQIGPLKLGDLKPGCWRHLTENEIECFTKPKTQM